MKHRLCIFAAFAALILLAGCRRIVLPEEEPEAGGDSYNSEAPVVDRDSEEDSGMAGVMTEKGSYHGYETLADYLNVFGSPDRPIPMEDVLPGGCLYTLIMQEARISSILNCWVEGFVVGFENREDRVFGVQFHLESAPGPTDNRYLFDRFIQMMEEMPHA